MSPDTSASPCDLQRLNDYLEGELSLVQMESVESHLSTCKQCSQKLEAEAAPAESWSQIPSALDSDELDGTCSEPSCLFENELREPLLSDAEIADAECDDAVSDSMLTREIRGWLDPTDDPEMLGRFAGYEIVGIVGHGGMGIVLKGFERSLNRFVAIKAMAPRLASSGAARKRFAREAQAAAAVLHENVIAIHRVDQAHGLPFLVMPYLGGESLQRRIDNEGPLGLEASLRIASQVAAGLAAAHARGLIHRDIKPANILLQRGVQRVTITDFGLARAADDASLTRTGMIAGTPQFMSPEQARAQPLDARSDLFSLGSLLYVMLTGRPPFRGETNHDVVERVATHSATSIREIDSSMPRWVINLVEWMHEKSRDARPTSAAEVGGVIDACLLHLQDHDMPIPEPLQTRPGRTRRKRFVQLALLSAILCAVVAAFAAGPPSTPPSPIAPADDAERKQGMTRTNETPPFDTSGLTAESFGEEMSEIESTIFELEQ